MILRPLFIVSIFLSACSSSAPNALPAVTDAGSPGPTTTDPTDGGDAAADAGVAVDKAKLCASTFGAALTSAFGRLDGTVLAVVQPKDTQCPLPNNDHVILEVTSAGAAYRMVINVQSDRAGVDPKVRFGAFTRADPGIAYADGWHPGAPLDYVDSLSIHSTDPAFQPHELTELSQRLADMVEIGDKISVYATSSGGNSAHLVHRNLQNQDGAIVVRPGSPGAKMLLFYFAEQTF